MTEGRRKTGALAVLAAGLLGACQGPAAAQAVVSQQASFRVVTLASGLEHPWGLAFLPDGRMLVTERPGRLRIVGVDGRLAPQPIAGLPEVAARGQGGLLDVAPHPDFARNRQIYLSYAAPGPGGAGTRVARARLEEGGLVDLAVVFDMARKTGSGQHFGSRLAFAPDGMLYITTGDRGERDRAQDLGDHAGKLLRITPEGGIPADNPFRGRPGARPEVFAYGIRNAQGMAVHPLTGAVWMHEHGPRGGDEINIARAGANYGWPLVTFGREYSGGRVGEGRSEAHGLAPPLLHWTPSIAPSGMAFYAGDRFPQWRGDLFVGALAGRHLVRLELAGERVVGQERLLEGLGRIRDVRAGPDGLLYLLTDESSGRLLRLEPAG